MKLNDLSIREHIELTNIEYIEHGYLKGYITAMLVDKRPNANFIDYSYEVLYRVHDTANGPDYTLVSIDYGYYLEDDNIFSETENKLTEAIKSATAFNNRRKDLYSDNFCVITDIENGQGLYADMYCNAVTMPILWAKKAAALLNAGSLKNGLHLIDIAENLHRRKV